jgi:hypothetical protein
MPRQQLMQLLVEVWESWHSLQGNRFSWLCARQHRHLPYSCSYGTVQLPNNAVRYVDGTAADLSMMRCTCHVRSSWC